MSTFSRKHGQANAMNTFGEFGFPMDPQASIRDWWGWIPSPWHPSGPGGYQPRIDLCDTEHEYRVTAELPGINPDEIEVTISNNTLLVKGERRQEMRLAGECIRWTELQYGPFLRAISFPTKVDLDQVSALFENGLLTIRVAKARDVIENTRRIPIRVS